MTSIHETKPESEHLLLVTELADLERANPVKPGGYKAQRIGVTPEATLVQIAFDADVELADHKAATPIIVQVLDGEIDFSVGEQTYHLCFGGMIHVAANTIHAVYAEKSARILITFLTA